MAPDGNEQPEPSFGDFSIEGMQDPLAPREREEYVEELDPDPAPLGDLVQYDIERRPGMGSPPWSGASALRGGSRGVSRSTATVVVAVIVLLAAGLLIWRLVV